MPLNAPHGLSKGIRSSMQVIRMASPMPMKYDDRSFIRIFGIMQIPIMPGIPAHNRHITFINCDDIKILRIQ